MFVNQVALYCSPAPTTLSCFATVLPQPAQTESQESTAISSLMATANFHINQTIQAIQNDNSSEALRLLSELRSDISNINGNVTNLIFSAYAQPP